MKDSEPVKHLFKVLENFTSNDRSQFLRFVTGRRRLPAAVYVDLGYVNFLYSLTLISYHGLWNLKNFEGNYSILCL